MIDLIKNTFDNLQESELPSWLDPVVENDVAVIKSYSWTADRCRRIRICDLEIKDKFTAITLVIYPEYDYETPIFGSEYLRIAGKKFFGATDFHPVKDDEEYEKEYILRYLSEFPDRDKENSKFYDLTKFFSKKFWIRKTEYDFYDEYLEVTSKFLQSYKECLTNSVKTDTSYKFQVDYDEHMAANDPAHGILKSYYSQTFADNYIKTFLFDLNSRYD